MKYDVFISYSSKNTTTAQAICHELEDNGIKCWMAPRDIPVGSKYASVITRAIKECKAVVLVFSEQSAISPWVESEINIAFSNRKPIVPYKIDVVNLESYDEFYLMLNNRHWIEAYPDFKTRFAEMVAVVSSLVGSVADNADKDISAKTPVTASTIVHNPEPIKNEETQLVPQLAVSNKYKVGDYYCVGDKRGVVFEVWDGGEHGKIISLDETEKAWDSQVKWDSLNGYSGGTITYADSTSDGKANTDKIMARSDSRYFDAFVWCRAKGSSWYLPSIDELLQICGNIDELNSTLSKYNATNLGRWLWSSSECLENKPWIRAWIVLMGDGNTGKMWKSYKVYVRAVSAF